MSQRPISLSPDLRRLREEGYDIEIRSGHLVVKSVPYVNATKEVLRGTLVSVLTLAGDVAAPPTDHVAMFAGEYPCRADGSPIEGFRHASERKEVAPGLFVDHSFSGKSTAGAYKDFHEKMTRYIAIISAPAAALDPEATARTYPFVEATEEESAFAYIDTASSSTGTVALGQRLEQGAVGIVGLGGTGSYVLDLVAKTPVKHIHLFDGDHFLQHNAFRSPGAASCDELRAKPRKVDYLAAEYSKMHRGIVPHPYFVEQSNIEALRGMEFVFLCLDRGLAKKEIVQALLGWGVPFIDVGLGVELGDDNLGGILTVTTVTSEKSDHIERRIRLSEADPDADYSRNIQIADLNALNAAMAVIKWKKLRGFYRDQGREHFSAYTIGTGVLTNEEQP